MCKAAQQWPKWYGETLDDRALSATQSAKSSDFKIAAEQCFETEKTGTATIISHKVPFNKYAKEQTVINKGDVSDKYSNERTAKE